MVSKDRHGLVGPIADRVVSEIGLGRAPFIHAFLAAVEAMVPEAGFLRTLYYVAGGPVVICGTEQR